MRKLFAKMRKVRKARWCKLTTGEKIMKVIMKLIKIAVIVALIVTFASAIAAIVMGVLIGFGIMNAVAGGFSDASRAYRPGDRYVHFWK